MSKFVQYYKKNLESTPKKSVFRAEGAYMHVSDRGMRKTSHRFQSTEPRGNRDRFKALKDCLNFTQDGMFDNDKFFIDKVIKKVETELWAKSKAAKIEWWTAWTTVQNIEATIMPDIEPWGEVKRQSKKLLDIWTKVNQMSMKVDGKSELDAIFQNERELYDAAETNAESSGETKDDWGARGWLNARKERIDAYEKWWDIFTLSTWNAEIKYSNDWEPPSLSKYDQEETTKGNTDEHDAQIKIRTWARFVIEEILVGKQIQVYYNDSEDTTAGWYTGTVSTGVYLNMFYENGEIDERLYIQLDDGNFPLQVLRIEFDDEEEDQIRFPPQGNSEDEHSDESEDDTILDLDDAAVTTDDEDEDDLIGQIGIVVNGRYAYIGEITGRRLTPGPLMGSSVVDMHQYELTCGSDHVITNIWVEGDKKYFLGSLLDLYEPDYLYKEGDTFKSVNIVRTYTQLEGPNAGKEVAVLANGKQKTFEEMTREIEEDAIEEAIRVEDEEEENDRNGDVLFQGKIFYYETDGTTYQVYQGTPYLMYNTIEELKEHMEETEKEQLDMEAQKNYEAEKQEEENSRKQKTRGETKEEKTGAEEETTGAEEDNYDDYEEETNISKSEYIAQYKKMNPVETRNMEDWQELFESQSELVDLITLDGSKKFDGVDASLIMAEPAGSGLDEELSDVEFASSPNISGADSGSDEESSDEKSEY